MFDFRNGMLGVVIIALAIAGALFGGYLAGIDTEEVEVTKYDYLADVTGLFDYDEFQKLIKGKDAQPAHGNVEQGRNPLWTVNKKDTLNDSQ